MILPFNKEYETAQAEFKTIDSLFSSLMWLYEDLEKGDLTHDEIKGYLGPDEWSLYDYYKLDDIFGFNKKNRKFKNQVKECPKCGYPVNAESRICLHCDYRFNEKNKEKDEKKKNKDIEPVEIEDQAKSFEELAKFFYAIGEDEKALDYYEQAKNIRKELLN